jgi:hypothetical protein
MIGERDRPGRCLQRPVANRFPAEARIAVVTESRALPDSEVRARFRRVKPLSEISVVQHGWTLDVLNHPSFGQFGGSSSERPKLFRSVRASWNSALRHFHNRRRFHLR